MTAFTVSPIFPRTGPALDTGDRFDSNPNKKDAP